MFRTVTARLTLRFVSLLTFLYLIVFFFLFYVMKDQLHKRMDDHLRIEAREFDAVFLSSKTKDLQRTFMNEGDVEGIKRVFLKLFSPNGRMLAHSNLSEFPGLPPLRPELLPVDGTPLLETIHLKSRSAAIRLITRRNADGNVFQMGVSLAEDSAFVNTLAYQLFLSMVALLIAGGTLGWLTARDAMSGVERVANTAKRIDRTDLGVRVPLGEEGEEIECLAQGFNGMLERIELLVREQREVNDNIAHDLRSPITRIRGVAETTVMSQSSMNDYREMAGMVIEECDKLTELINTMLAIAKAEAAGFPLPSEAVDARALTNEAIELFSPVAEQKGVNLIGLNLSGPTVTIHGEKAKLQRVLSNLLDNAIKFTDSGGTVSTSLNIHDDKVIITVKDTGCGISEEQIDNVFDTFYRADTSRSKPGSGLGLSLARAYVLAHDGTLTVQSLLNEGTSFHVELPLSRTSF